MTTQTEQAAAAMREECAKWHEEQALKAHQKAAKHRAERALYPMGSVQFKTMSHRVKLCEDLERSHLEYARELRNLPLPSKQSPVADGNRGGA